MGKVYSHIAWRISRNFNVETRAQKLLAQEKIRPPPKLKSTEKYLETLRKGKICVCSCFQNDSGAIIQIIYTCRPRIRDVFQMCLFPSSHSSWSSRNPLQQQMQRQISIKILSKLLQDLLVHRNISKLLKKPLSATTTPLSERVMI